MGRLKTPYQGSNLKIPIESDLDRLSDVTISSPSNDEVLVYDSGSGKWLNKAPTFLKLDDTPSSFAGAAGRYIRVTPDENALEYADTALFTATKEETVIYVDTTGNDVTGDGSAENPFASVGRAIQWFKENAAYILHESEIRMSKGTYTVNEEISLDGLLCSSPLTIHACATDGTPFYTNGLASGGAGNTITLEAGTSWPSDHFTGCKVWIFSGTGAGQIRTVTASSSDDPCVLTVDPAWDTVPDNTSYYVVGGGAVLQGDGSFIMLRGTGLGAVYILGLGIDNASQGCSFKAMSDIQVKFCHIFNCVIGVSLWNSLCSTNFNYIVASDNGIILWRGSYDATRRNVLIASTPGSGTGVSIGEGGFTAMHGGASSLNYFKDWNKGIYASRGGLVDAGSRQTFVNCTTNTYQDGSQPTIPSYIS